jgi:hypothetical protein
VQRLARVLELVKEHLGGYSPRVTVVEHSVYDDAEYPSVRVRVDAAGMVASIREYLRGGEVAAYGYYIRVGGYEEWWDNRPHHPEVETFPHHRHVEGRIEPLHQPSLEAFLEHARRLLERQQGVSSQG